MNNEFSYKFPITILGEISTWKKSQFQVDTIERFQTHESFGWSLDIEQVLRLSLILVLVFIYIPKNISFNRIFVTIQIRFPKSTYWSWFNGSLPSPQHDGHFSNSLLKSAGFVMGFFQILIVFFALWNVEMLWYDERSRKKEKQQEIHDG